MLGNASRSAAQEKGGPFHLVSSAALQFSPKRKEMKANPISRLANRRRREQNKTGVSPGAMRKKRTEGENSGFGRSPAWNSSRKDMKEAEAAATAVAQVDAEVRRRRRRTRRWWSGGAGMVEMVMGAEVNPVSGRFRWGMMRGMNRVVYGFYHDEPAW